MQYKDRTEPLQLNIGQILHKRLTGAKRLLVPPPVVQGLENVIHQEELNRLLRATFPAQGSDFAKRLLKELEITVRVTGLDNIPEDEKVIFASNHPLGGLDGITLIGILGDRYGDENVRFIVNDMLMNVEPVANVFLPVNKYGSQGRQAAKDIAEAYESGKQILIFPAGLVSRLCEEGIRDLRWQKAFVSKALETGRRIVPVRFGGENTMKFYKTAKWRKKVGLKFNIEQALLPGELCKAKGNNFRVSFGAPIDVRPLRESGLKPQEIADRIRREVYELPFE